MLVEPAASAVHRRAFSLVGMGAAVTRDVPTCEIWAGVLARRSRAADITHGADMEEFH